MERNLPIILYLIGLFMLGVLYSLLRRIYRASSRSILHRGFWGERRLYQWLQDRAVARTLGMDIDLVRARRKIDTADAPINVGPKK